MEMASGAEIIVRLLEREGIRIVAGIPGGAALPLYDALGRSSQIRHVLARHEQGAGFIAHGLARATGEPAVCFATSGPGATNLLTAVADAKLDSIPVVFVTGQVPTGMIGTDAFQEVDISGMCAPVVKGVWAIRSAAELLSAVPEAFRRARSGRPGPVLIDVPKDVQNEVLAIREWPEASLARVPDARPTPHREALWAPHDEAPRAPHGTAPRTARAAPLPPDPALLRAAALIDRAQRPVLYVGGGAVHSGASGAVIRLAERAGIPTTMTLMGLGTLPSGHELSLGMLGMHAARWTNLVLEESDLLIAAGVRFDDRATGRLSAFCPRAEVIHIDVDPRELGKLRSATVGIVGDLREVLEHLGPLVREQGREPWRARVDQLRELHPLRTPGSDDPRTPYGLIRAVAEAMEPDSVVTTDVGQHQMWVAQAFPFQRPRSLLTSGGLGTMGFGLPAAIGAALADPGRPVLCFTGDGSLLMNIQELAVVAEEGLDIKVIVMDNASLGMVHQQQDLFYGGRRFASEFRGRVDLAQIAIGFGVAALDLGAAAAPREALREALGVRGPMLIRAPIGIREKVFPMVPPGAGNGEMLGGEAEEPQRVPSLSR